MSGTYSVQIAVSGPRRQLLSGMSASVSIVTARAANALLVPNTAIQTTAAGRFVDAIDQNNRLVRVPVNTGISDEDYTQILGGLRPGQRILLFPPAGGGGAE